MAMLSYELCKKLKDAGFPQPKIVDAEWEWNGALEGCFHCGDNFNFYDDEGIKHNTVNLEFDPEEDFFDPSLEQLIEACGDGFRSLRIYRVLNEDDRVMYGSWPVYAQELDEPQGYEEKTPIHWYETPEEAIANLYLYLNLKK